MGDLKADEGEKNEKKCRIVMNFKHKPIMCVIFCDFNKKLWAFASGRVLTTNASVPAPPSFTVKRRKHRQAQM